MERRCLTLTGRGGARPHLTWRRAEEKMTWGFCGALDKRQSLKGREAHSACPVPGRTLQRCLLLFTTVLHVLIQNHRQRICLPGSAGISLQALGAHAQSESITMRHETLLGAGAAKDPAQQPAVLLLRVHCPVLALIPVRRLFFPLDKNAFSGDVPFLVCFFPQEALLVCK